jgi:hypothetical protein
VVLMTVRALPPSPSPPPPVILRILTLPRLRPPRTQDNELIAAGHTNFPYSGEINPCNKKTNGTTASQHQEYMQPILSDLSSTHIHAQTDIPEQETYETKKEQ